MTESSQLYLVDSNSFLIPHWPGLIFFMGTGWNPLIYESNSPISKVVALPADFTIEEIPHYSLKHKLKEFIHSNPVPILCVTNPDELEHIETGLMISGFYFITLDDEVFQLDPEITLDELNEIGLKDLPCQKFEALPKTLPLVGWKLGPYIDSKNDLIIPHYCDQVWKYWLDGLSPDIIIQCFASVIDPKIYHKLKKNYSTQYR